MYKLFSPEFASAIKVLSYSFSTCTDKNKQCAILNQMRSSLLRTKELIFVGRINFLGLRTKLIYLLTGWILSDHAIGYAP